MAAMIEALGHSQRKTNNYRLTNRCKQAGRRVPSLQ